MTGKFRLKSSHITSLFILIFVTYLIGLRNVLPTSINWLLYYETAQSYLGWAFFRQSELVQWPLYLNTIGGISINSSIAYTASNPLISILLKYLLFPFRDVELQFHSLWIFIIFLLQYLVFRKILLKYNISGYLLEISSMLILLQPFWLFRLRLGHIDGMAHFLILAAIYNYINRSKPIFWFITIAVSAAVHPYLNIMVFLIYLLYLSISGEFRIIDRLKWLCLMTISNFIILFISGFFHLGADSSAMSGYGLFKTNLNALFDSGVDLNDGFKHQYSFLIPDLPQNLGDYEGYSFVGLGIITSGFIVCINLLKTKLNHLSQDSKRFIYLLLFTLFMFILSLSNNIDFGNKRIFTIPSFILTDKFFDYFRVSARFSWPFIYVCLILIIVLFAKIQTKKFKSELWLSAILFIQFIDALPLISEIRNTYVARSEWKTELNLLVWDEVIQKNNIKQIIMVNPVNNPEFNIDLSKLALDNSIGINFGYFARVSEEAIQAQNYRYRTLLRLGDLDKNTLYLLKGRNELQAYIHGNKSKCKSFFREKDYFVVYHTECVKND
jgi:hypothetical protein